MEIKECVKKLEDTVEDLKDELEVVKQQNKKLKKENKDLKEKIKNQNSRIQELEKEVSKNKKELKEDIIQEKENRAKADKDLHNKLDKIQQEDITEKIETKDMSKIQKLSTLNEEELEDTSTPTTQRAVTIYQNFEEWSKQTIKGYSIGSQTENLKKLLETKLETSLHPQQVHRAMKKLGELSNKIKYKDNGRHGKKLILETNKNKKQNNQTNIGVS